MGRVNEILEFARVSRVKKYYTIYHKWKLLTKFLGKVCSSIEDLSKRDPTVKNGKLCKT